MRLSILLRDGALDIVGGYEVLANLPGMDVEFVAPAAAWSGLTPGAWPCRPGAPMPKPMPPISFTCQVVPVKPGWMTLS